MKYYKIVFCLAFILLEVVSFGQTTVHAVVFAATEDLFIGKGISKSLKIVRDELTRINIGTDGEVEVKVLPYTEDNFSKKGFYQAIKDLKKWNLENDVVIFYFMGHGFLSDEFSTPNLLFYNTSGPLPPQIIKDNHINLKDVHTMMKEIGARLTISVGESCNTILERSNEAQFEDNGKKNIERAPIAEIKKPRYIELMKVPKGDIILQSSLRGQFSYVSDENGGIFAQAFVASIQDIVTSHSIASWERLFRSVKQKTELICEKSDITEIQRPDGEINVKLDGEILLERDTFKATDMSFLGTIIGKFQGGKIKKALRRTIKDKNPRQKLYFDLQKEEIAEKNILYQPFSHYMLLGIMGDQLKENQSVVFLNFSVAKGLLYSDPSKLTDVDNVVAAELSKLADRKSGKSDLAREISEAGNIRNWLVGKQEKSGKILEDSLNFSRERLKDLRDDRIKIENQIVNKQRRILNINKQIDSIKNDIIDKQRTIGEIRLQKESRVNTTIANISSLNEDDLNKVKTYIECLQLKGIVDSCSADIPTIVAAGFVNVNVALDSNTVTGKLEPEMKGVAIGKYKNKKIEAVTNFIVTPLINILKIVPKEDEYMNAISINGTIKGYADYRGAGGKLLNIECNPTEDIREEYVNKFDDLKIAQFTKGKNVRITNEQLAFLRAYYSYNILREKIYEATDGMFDLDNKDQLNIDFFAIEQSKKETDKAEDFRGVTIDINVENLYNFLENKMQDMSLDIQEMKVELEELQNEKTNVKYEIESLKNQRSNISKDIREEDRRMREIEKNMYKNDLGGSIYNGIYDTIGENKND